MKKQMVDWPQQKRKEDDQMIGNGEKGVESDGRSQ